MVDLLTVYVIVPHPSERKLLLVANGEGWSLPSFSLPGRYYGADAAAINAAMAERFGLKTTVLCQVEQGQGYRIYAMENHGSAPETGVWLGRHELPDFPQRQAAERWFAAPPAPWFRAVEAWVRERTNDPGAALEQVKLWHISSILRVTSRSGVLYFKTAPSHLPAEPAVTHLLDQLYPGHVPSVAGAHLDRRWLLTWDFGGDLLGSSSNLTDYEAALRLYAQIQQELTMCESELLGLGCNDLRTGRLIALLHQLCADWRTLLSLGLEPDEIEQLRAKAPSLERSLRILATFGLPESLDHGDFHANNIALLNGRVVIFDWADAAFSHPFFSMKQFLDTVRDSGQFPDPEGVCRHLRKTYLEAWSAYGEAEALYQACELAEQLQHLQGTLRDYGLYLQTADKGEWGAMVARWLRELIAT